MSAGGGVWSQRIAIGEGTELSAEEGDHCRAAWSGVTLKRAGLKESSHRRLADIP